MNYEELLGRASDKSSSSQDSERFEPPEPEVTQEGNKTIIKNFSEVVDTLRRPKDHFLKFLSKELAAPGDLDGSRAVFQGKFSKRQVEEKLDSYMDEFVLCPACNKVDTELVEEERITKIKCEACGTKQAVKEL
ncbi:MAG: translation initiation factor IF-2 subunit beta [Candidatus Aenigmatarchaeota archaeon]